MHSQTAPISHQAALQKFIQQIEEQSRDFLGFQTSQAGAASTDELAPLLQCNLLNIGDAFTNGHFRVNAKGPERDVLDFYARHWHAPVPEQPNTADSYWGYVTTMGSSEGNFFGLWNGRDYLKGRASVFETSPINTLPPLEKEPVLFTSHDVHYSVAKAAHVLGLALPSHVALTDAEGNNAPEFIDADETGAINCDSVVKWATLAHERGHPLLFALTVGTTFRGGADSITTIIERLPQVFSDHSKRHAWIHIDGAISANSLPWLEQAVQRGDWSSPLGQLPQFDFRIPAISSICCSPYKWMGAPFPFGVYLTRGHFRLQPPTHPRYIGCADSTLSGSRSGLACVYAWNYIRSRTAETHMRDIIAQQNLVDYAYKQLRSLSGNIRCDHGLFRVLPVNPGSPIICFTQPPDFIVEKFSLACEDGLAHIVVLNHVDQALIDLLITSLKKYAL